MRREKARVRHAKRNEDRPRGEAIERLACHFLYQKAQHFEIDIAVDEPCARRIHRLLLHGHCKRGGAALPWRREVEIGREAGEVRQQFANRDVLLAVLRELRQIGCHRIIEAHAAVLNQLHHRGCGCDALGERGKIEDRIGGHGLAFRLERAVTEGFAIDHAAIVADEQNSARDGALRNRVLHERVEHRMHPAGG